MGFGRGFLAGVAAAALTGVAAVAAYKLYKDKFEDGFCFFNKNDDDLRYSCDDCCCDEDDFDYSDEDLADFAEAVEEEAEEVCGPDGCSVDVTIEENTDDDE